MDLIFGAGRIIRDWDSILGVFGRISTLPGGDATSPMLISTIVSSFGAASLAVAISGLSIGKSCFCFSGNMGAAGETVLAGVNISD